MAHLITPDGTVTVRATDNPEGFDLDTLYKLLDCSTIEVVKFPEGAALDGVTYHLAVIDEEGKLKDAPRINVRATVLWARAHGIFRTQDLGDVLVGNVLFVTDEEFQ